jgi:hypothetical protein
MHGIDSFTSTELAVRIKCLEPPCVSKTLKSLAWLNRKCQIGFVPIRLTLIHHKIVVGSMVYIELAHEQANKIETELY